MNEENKNLLEEIGKRFDAKTEEIKRHFDVVAEEMKGDFKVFGEQLATVSADVSVLKKDLKVVRQDDCVKRVVRLEGVALAKV